MQSDLPNRLIYLKGLLKMNNTELRDSIAKELFTKPGSLSELDAKMSFDAADIFMEEKLRRENRHYLGKFNDEEKS